MSEPPSFNIYLFADVKLIMPTLLILLFTIFIMVTVIPYAFSSVIKQLKAVRALEAAGETLVIHNLHLSLLIGGI